MLTTMKEAAMVTKGHCFCKSTRWEYTGEMAWACYCHCDDCRRNCAAPVVAWLGVPLKNFKWVGSLPNTYSTEDGVSRHFCGTCGSPIGFEADHYPGGMHLYAASMEDPAQFKPTFHVNVGSKLPWLEMTDRLKTYPGRLVDSPEDLIDYE